MTRIHSRTIGVDEVMQGQGNVEDTIAHTTLNTSQMSSYPNNTHTMDGDSTTDKILDYLIRHNINTFCNTREIPIYGKRVKS